MVNSARRLKLNRICRAMACEAVLARDPPKHPRSAVAAVEPVSAIQDVTVVIVPREDQENHQGQRVVGCSSVCQNIARVTSV